MIVPCENVQELSPSLRGVGCFPQDFSSQDTKACLCIYIFSAVFRLIRFRGCTATGLGG